MARHLSSDANDTASRARTSIARLLRLLGSAPAQIIGAGVDDDSALQNTCQLLSGTAYARTRVEWKKRKGSTYANNALGANELDQLVLNAALRITLTVGLEVAQVADMALVVLRSAVGLVVRVDCVPMSTAPQAKRLENESLTVRSGGGATIRVITEGVHMHTTLGIRIVTRDVPRDSRRARLVRLLESDGALDVGVSTEDGDYASSAPCPNESSDRKHEQKRSHHGVDRRGADWSFQARGQAKSRNSEGDDGPSWSSSDFLRPIQPCASSPCARNRRCWCRREWVIHRSHAMTMPRSPTSGRHSWRLQKPYIPALTIVTVWSLAGKLLGFVKVW